MVWKVSWLNSSGLLPFDLENAQTVLLVSTKLQFIITEMALEIQERHAIVQGTPIVQPTDFFGSVVLNLFFSWSISLCSRYQNAFHTNASLTNSISKSCLLNIHGNGNALMVSKLTLCSIECFPACFLLVDMGRNYVHLVKNELLHVESLDLLL